MDKGNYFVWLAENTQSGWNNDSAVISQIDNAVSKGAVGATSNPPLSYEALTLEQSGGRGLYSEELKGLDRDCDGDEFAMRAMGLVIKRISEHFLPMHEKRGTFFGSVRAQVAPNLRHDAEGMLGAGLRLSKINKNVMVKIPGTKAGIATLEELTARGVPTNPTVIATVSQAVAAAEAFERGCDRAAKSGAGPAWSTCAIVMGRAQDYFANLNKERGLGLSVSDLDWAVLAIMKRCYEIFMKRGYRSVLMPAAFRSARQVEQLSGARVLSTIHPKIQAEVERLDNETGMQRVCLIDSPPDMAAVKLVAAALPEFSEAYEEGALTPEQFDGYGAVVMTLDTFDREGWQKLITLK